MTRKKKFSLQFALAAALTVSSVALIRAQQSQAPQGLAAADVEKVPPKATERLQEAVRRELVMLPFYGVFDNLEYTVHGYTVNLMGQVTRPTLKSDAEAAVKKIEGVESVVNQIEVLPVSPSDDRIRLSVYRAIFHDGPLERYALQAVPPIHIIVKNGHVTLAGVVANDMDRTLAETKAKGVSGVFSVTNKLKAEKSKES